MELNSIAEILGTNAEHVAELSRPRGEAAKPHCSLVEAVLRSHPSFWLSI